MAAQRFRVNTPNVVHEIIEGEAVIVNLANGMYYSVDRAGADIWSLIENGVSVPAITSRLTELYTGDVADIQAGIEQFIAQLHAEHLIVSDGDTPLASEMSVGGATPAGHKPRFEAPTLQRYSDMEDLLLLDPLHDVDEQQGWPTKAR